MPMFELRTPIMLSMTNATYCANCGRPLDQGPEVPEAQRQPCPDCGSLARRVDVVLYDSATATDSLSIGVQLAAGPRPWSELWLQVQHQLETLRAMYDEHADSGGSQAIQGTVQDFFIN